MEIQREFGLGVSRARFPAEAVAFIERAGITGRAFNCLAMGGYLTWTRPDDAVFVDGRLEAFPEERLPRATSRSMDEPGDVAAAVAPYALDYALLYHGWSNRLPLVNYLAEGHGWTIVYYDEIASVFVPDDEAHREMRERALAASPTSARRGEQAARSGAAERARVARSSCPVAETWRQRSYGNFLRSVGLPDEAATAFRALARARPGSARRALLARVRVLELGSSARPRSANGAKLLRRDPTERAGEAGPVRAATGALRRR